SEDVSLTGTATEDVDAIAPIHQSPQMDAQRLFIEGSIRIEGRYGHGEHRQLSFDHDDLAPSSSRRVPHYACGVVLVRGQRRSDPSAPPNSNSLSFCDTSVVSRR